MRERSGARATASTPLTVIAARVAAMTSASTTVFHWRRESARPRISVRIAIEGSPPIFSTVWTTFEAESAATIATRSLSSIGRTTGPKSGGGSLPAPGDGAPVGAPAGGADFGVVAVEALPGAVAGSGQAPSASGLQMNHVVLLEAGSVE